MSGKIYVKPATPGAIVPQADRDMRPLPQAGDWVTDSILWRRLINNGDVVEAEPANGPAPERRLEDVLQEMNDLTSDLVAAKSP